MIIHLNKIIPSPLEEKSDNKSDVWRRDLFLKNGERYLVSAESGTGKTSLISLLFGLRDDYSGSIFFDNENISEFGITKWTALRRSVLSIVPQGLWLFDDLTAFENINVKNRLTNHLNEEDIKFYLNETGMYEHRNKKARILSYGQKQRIAILRALCQPFDFLFMDEAFSHLDEGNSETIFNIVENELKERNAGLIFTSLGQEIQGFEHTLRL